MELLFALLPLIVIMGAAMGITGAIGASKGGSFWKWALLGILFPLGLLVAIITPRQQGVSGNVSRKDY